MTDVAPDARLLLGLIGRFDHIQLVELPDGRWQGSSRAVGSKGYSVSISEDPLEAFIGVTGDPSAVEPPSNDDWKDLI